MLSESIVREVQFHLSQGLTQRQIAKNLGVSRGSIQAIATGKRPAWTESEPTRRVRVRGQFHNHLEKPTRCGGCGALVHGDCVLCELRAAIARKGPNTNVEIPTVDELHGALHGLTYAATAVVDNQVAVDELDIRLTLSPGHLRRALKIRDKNLREMRDQRPQKKRRRQLATA